MNLIWSKESEEDLVAIHHYIAQKSPWNASKQIERIVLRAEWISEKPMRGHPVHEFSESGCFEVHEDKYRIIYQIRGETLNIVTVIHMRQMLNVDRLR